MFFCCDCRVLSGRRLCDELITRPEESYRLWCVVCVWPRNLLEEEAMTRVGSQRHRKKNTLFIYLSLIPTSHNAGSTYVITGEVERTGKLRNV